MNVYKVVLMPQEDEALAFQGVVIRAETYHSKFSLTFIFMKFFNDFQSAFCIEGLNAILKYSIRR